MRCYVLFDLRVPGGEEYSLLFIFGFDLRTVTLVCSETKQPDQGIILVVKIVEMFSLLLEFFLPPHAEVVIMQCAGGSGSYTKRGFGTETQVTPSLFEST